MSWFAIMTKPQMEFRAVGALERLAINAQCPVAIERRFRRSYESERRRPLFPGYIFVEMAYIPHWFTDEDWYIKALPSRQAPRDVPDEAVQAALLLSGIITVNEWRQMTRFAKGDTVRRKGDLSGLTGVVVSAKHRQLIVLFRLLGESKLRFHQDQIEAAE